MNGTEKGRTNGATRARLKAAHRRTAARQRLKAAHRRVAGRLEVIFDTQEGAASRLISKHAGATARRYVTRLANLVGVVSAVSVSDTYTRAMMEVYARAARGEDMTKALQWAATVRRNADPSRWLTPPPAAPAAPVAAPLDEPTRTKRKLLDELKAYAERPETVKLTRIAAPPTQLLDFGIRPGDTLRVTIDGDAEHGELAVITYYNFGRRERRLEVGFLIIEGDHICLRYRSPNECEDGHYAPDELTIIGRVVRVERGGLPLRLKGLELRGLPFANEVEEDEGARRRAA